MAGPISWLLNFYAYAWTLCQLAISSCVFLRPREWRLGENISVCRLLEGVPCSHSSGAIINIGKENFLKWKKQRDVRTFFYFNDDSPRFPFYWTNKPEMIRKLPDSALTAAEKLDVDFLSIIHLNLSDFYAAYSEQKLSNFVKVWKKH